jgi:hypothetical protein
MARTYAYTACFLVMVSHCALATVNPNDYYNNISKFTQKKDSSYETSNLESQNIWGDQGMKQKVSSAVNTAPEKSYFDNDGQLDIDAQTQKTQSDAYKGAMDVYHKEPDINMIANSGYVQNNQIYVKDAYNISHGISDKEINCEGGTVCRYNNIVKHCTKTISQEMTCTKTPVVKVTNDPYQVSESYSGNMSHSGVLQYNADLPENGTITSFKFSSTGKQGMRANSDYKFYLNGVYIGIMPHTSPYGIWISTISINAPKISVPVSAKHILLSVTGYNDDAIWSSPFSLTMLVTHYHKVSHVTWVTQCSNI